MVTPSSTHFEVLVGEVDVLQRLLQQRRVAGGLAVEAVGEALAVLVGVGEFVFVAPGAAVDELVDVRAVGPFGVGEHAEAGGLHVEAHLGRVAQRMGADEVQRLGLVGGGGVEGGFGEHPGLQRQEVAEDAGEGHHHVDARAAEFGQRHQVGAGEPAVAVEAGLRADQRQGLGDRAAVGLDVVAAPEHQRHSVRQRRVGGEQAVWRALPSCIAKAVGIRNGSKAWMLRPVGRMCGGGSGRRRARGG